MKNCENCDPFENYDALVILTRQGCVMTAKDTQLTFGEDAQLYKLNKIIADRTKRMNETGLDHKQLRVTRDGTIELKRQQDKTRSKMFQFMKMKKGGRRK